jgi:hypothetical protein
MSRSTVWSVALTALLALGLAADTALAAPSGLPEKKLDLDLKQASVVHVFRLLGDVSKREIVLDPCVRGEVDLRLQNTPLPLVFDALALKLGLVYGEDSGAITVGCQGTNSTGTRISVSEKEAPLPDVLQRVAASAKLEGVDYRASKRPKVSLTVESVRLSTAVKALAETGNVEIAVHRKRLVVTD